jgi:hypothetical protein
VARVWVSPWRCPVRIGELRERLERLYRAIRTRFRGRASVGRGQPSAWVRSCIVTGRGPESTQHKPAFRPDTKAVVDRSGRAELLVPDHPAERYCFPFKGARSRSGRPPRVRGRGPRLNSADSSEDGPVRAGALHRHSRACGRMGRTIASREMQAPEPADCGVARTVGLWRAHSVTRERPARPDKRTKASVGLRLRERDRFYGRTGDAGAVGPARRPTYASIGVESRAISRATPVKDIAAT